MQNEREDIQGFLGWDEQAFRRLYKNYYKALVNYAQQIVGEMDAAEDVVQDVITKLWERKNNFATLISLEVFLYNSTRNASIDHLRRRKVESNYIQYVAEKHRAFSMDDENAIFGEEVYRMLFETIDSLPRRSREVILLYIKGKKNREIAEELCISPETVKTYKQRGMEKLRQKLGREPLLLLFLLTIDCC